MQDRPRAHSGDTGAEQTILDATEKLLEERQLHELSVATIGEAAGVSRTTFYFYFASKFSVVTRLLERMMEEMYAGVRPWLDAPGASSAEQLRLTLASSVDVWRRHGPLLRAVIESVPSDEALKAQWNAVLERFIEAFSTHITALRRDKLAPAGMDAKLLAAGLVWSTERILYVHSTGADPRLSSSAEVSEMLYLLWARTIGIAEEASRKTRGR
jgi:AcrR family transcriptional regulator